MQVPVSEFLPFVMKAVREAADDVTLAEPAASTAQCEHIVVFGSNRISQLASTVNAMLVFVAPLSLGNASPRIHPLSHCVWSNGLGPIPSCHDHND